MPALGSDALQIVGGRAVYRIDDGFLFYNGASPGGNRVAPWTAVHRAFAQSAVVRLNSLGALVEGFYLSPNDYPSSGTRLAGLNLDYRLTELLKTGFTYADRCSLDLILLSLSLDSRRFTGIEQPLASSDLGDEIDLDLDFSITNWCGNHVRHQCPGRRATAAFRRQPHLGPARAVVKLELLALPLPRGTALPRGIKPITSCPDTVAPYRIAERGHPSAAAS